MLRERPAAGTHRLIRGTVDSIVNAAPRVLRMRLTAPEFRDHGLSGPDEYFGLLMPPAGHDFRPFEIPRRANIRAVVSELPDAHRPETRWYTVRHLDRDAAAIDVDIITHGDGGPGSAWVRRARPGDTAGIYTCSGIWSRPTTTQLLVADATAAPALRSILEFASHHHSDAMADLHAVVLAPSRDVLEPGLEAEWGHRIGTLETIYEPAEQHAQALRQLLNAWRASGHPAADVGSTWTCGEIELARTARTISVKEWGTPTDWAGWAAYWFLGRPRL